MNGISRYYEGNSVYIEELTDCNLGEGTGEIENPDATVFKNYCINEGSSSIDCVWGASRGSVGAFNEKIEQIKTRSSSTSNDCKGELDVYTLLITPNIKRIDDYVLLSPGLGNYSTNTDCEIGYTKIGGPDAGVIYFKDGVELDYLGNSSLGKMSVEDYFYTDIPYRCNNHGKRKKYVKIDYDNVDFFQKIKSVGSESFAYKTFIKDFVYKYGTSTTNKGSRMFYNSIFEKNLNVEEDPLAEYFKGSFIIGTLSFKNVKEIYKNSFEESQINYFDGFNDEIEYIRELAFNKSYIMNDFVLSLPKNIKTIERGAFQSINNCDSIEYAESYYPITMIDFSKTTNDITIGEYAFGSSCGRIEELDIPGNVKTIGNYAFTGIVNSGKLKKLTFGEGVERIGDGAINNVQYAYDDYSALYSNSLVKELVIPSSITYIGRGNFSKFIGLDRLVFEDSDKSLSIGSYAFAESKINGGTLDLSRTSSIGEYVFYKAKSPDKIVIGNKITTISQYAFFDCGVKELDLGSSLKTIGKSAFEHNVSLKEVVIPPTVSSIGDRAFLDCTNLESVYLSSETPPTINEANSFPKTCTIYVDCKYYETYYNAWSSIRDRIKITGEDCGGKKLSYVLENGELGVIYCKSENETLQYSETRGLNIVSATVGDCVKSTIGTRNYPTFDYPIQEVIFSDSLETLGEFTFYGSSVKNVDLGNSVKTIGQQSFQSCDNLESITLPDSVETIGTQAFYSCEKLTNVSFSKNIKTIGSQAFTNSNVEGEVVLDKIESIGGYSFSGTNVYSIVLGDNISELNANALRGIEPLVKIEIGSGLTWIMDSALNMASSWLETLILRSVNPPSVGTYGIRYMEDTNIYVPDESVDAYKTDTNFRQYASHIYPLSSYNG